MGECPRMSCGFATAPKNCRKLPHFQRAQRICLESASGYSDVLQAITNPILKSPEEVIIHLGKLKVENISKHF